VPLSFSHSCTTCGDIFLKASSTSSPRGPGRDRSANRSAVPNCAIGKSVCSTQLCLTAISIPFHAKSRRADLNPETCHQFHGLYTSMWLRLKQITNGEEIVFEYSLHHPHCAHPAACVFMYRIYTTGEREREELTLESFAPSEPPNSIAHTPYPQPYRSAVPYRTSPAQVLFEGDSRVNRQTVGSLLHEALPVLPKAFLERSGGYMQRRNFRSSSCAKACRRCTAQVLQKRL